MTFNLLNGIKGNVCKVHIFISREIEDNLNNMKSLNVKKDKV